MIARLNAPAEAGGDAAVVDFSGQAAELAIVLTLDRIQRQPGSGARKAVRAEPWLSIEEDSGEHLIAYRQADDVAAAARRADPGLGDNGCGARSRMVQRSGAQRRCVGNPGRRAGASLRGHSRRIER